MERFVVTHMKEGIWSVACQEHTHSTYSTEEEALSATFALASSRRRAGIKTVVAITRAEVEDDVRDPDVHSPGSLFSMRRTAPRWRG
jgi:hypothetical protein